MSVEPYRPAAPAPKPIGRTITLPSLRLPSLQTILLVAVLGFVGYREYTGHAGPVAPPAPTAEDPAAVPVGKTYGGTYLEAGAGTLSAIADDVDAGKYGDAGAIVAAQQQAFHEALAKAWAPVAEKTAGQFGSDAGVKLDAPKRAAFSRWYRGLARGMRGR